MARRHVTTTVNGEPREFLCDVDQTLLDALRDELGLTGSKEGCGSATAARAASCWTDGWCAPAWCSRWSPKAARSRPSKGWRMASAASAAAGVPGGSRLAVRDLHSRVPGRREGAAGSGPGAERDRDPVLARREPLPLHRLRQDRAGGAEGGGGNARGGLSDGQRVRIGIQMGRHPPVRPDGIEQGNGAGELRRGLRHAGDARRPHPAQPPIPMPAWRASTRAPPSPCRGSRRW